MGSAIPTSSSLMIFMFFGIFLMSPNESTPAPSVNIASRLGSFLLCFFRVPSN